MPEFYASLLNNQPMGFYSPATIVKDGRRHGQRFRAVCIAESDWLCTIGDDNSIRLGLCVVRGISRTTVEEMLQERTKEPFASLEDFRRRTRFSRDELRTLAEIGALNRFAKHRRDALWQVEREVQQDLFATYNFGEPRHAELTEFSPLPMMDPVERTRADYHGTHMTVGPHPMTHLRERCNALQVCRAVDLSNARPGETIRIAGNVICRQRPGTAKGVVFITLEDETGLSNAIVAPPLFEKLRLVITEEPYLLIEGCLQNSQNVIVIQAKDIKRLPCDNLLGSTSHDFR
jgi:error-prone DNA polymerase